MAAALPLLLALAGVPFPAEDLSPLEALTESWRWRVFDREAGLGSNAVSAVHEDRFEYIYAATDRGIARYDFWEWTVLENTRAFDDGEVLRFVESRSELYAATRNSLWRVQGGTRVDIFHRGERIHAAANRLGEVYVIEEGTGRHLQVRGEGLDRIDAEVKLPPGRVLDYEVDAKNIHWLATSDGLFFREMSRRAWRALEDRDLGPDLSPRRCIRFLRVAATGEGRPARRASSGPGAFQELWAVFQDRRAGGSDGLLARIEDGVWAPLGSPAGPSFTHIARDAELGYFATAEDGGLHISTSGKEWRQADLTGLGRVAVHGVVPDASGILWFRPGTGGLAAFDPTSRRWEPLSSGTGQSFPNVLGILETDEGEVWMGMTSGVARHREGRPVETFRDVQGLALEKVTGLGEDTLHRVWVSSAESFHGAVAFDGSAWVKENLPGFSDHSVRRIVRDRVGELWFLSEERRPDGDRVIYRSSVYTSYELLPLRLPNGPVNDLVRVKEEEDVFWLATEEGLLRGAMDGEAFHLERRYTEEEGLRSTRTWSVAEAQDGSIWVSYPGGGVTRIQGEAMASYGEPEGLASSDVWSLVAVGPSIWIGTDRGLSRFDGECWYNYPVASSEPRTCRVWPIVPSRHETDSILFGTLGQGAFRFRLDDRRRPRFTSLDLPARARSDGRVVFSWEARDHRDQTLPSALLFRSRLDGGAWTPFSGARSREVKDLAPGDHAFEVEARDLDGNRNREEVVHLFVVPQVSRPGPVWPAAAAVLLLAGVLAGMRLRARMLETRLERRRLQGFFRDHPHPVLLLDPEGRIAEYNGVSPGLLGLEESSWREVVGRPVHLVPALASAGARSAVKDLLEGRPFCIEERITEGIAEHLDAAGGGERVIEIRGFLLRDGKELPGRAAPGARPAGAVVVVEDRSREHEERVLAERERRLRGIARASVRTASLIGDVLDLSRDEGRSRSDPEVAARIRRAETLRRRLAILFGRKDLPAEPVSVTRVLDGVLGSRDGAEAGPGFLPPPGIRVDGRAQPGLWEARAEESLLREALLEVLDNAVEAMAGKGDLTVRARNIRIEDDPGALPSGRYVEITVEDTGEGIEPSRIDSAFDPFYSTKPMEEAFGLGLSLAHAVLRAWGGDIRLRSRPGKGTAARIVLPAAG